MQKIVQSLIFLFNLVFILNQFRVPVLLVRHAFSIHICKIRLGFLCYTPVFAISQHIHSIQGKITSSCTCTDSDDMLMILSTTGIGLLLEVFPLIVCISGPKILSTRSMSFVLIGLIVIIFILIIAFMLGIEGWLRA